MSVRYPIISVTGSSGAGTTKVKQTFDEIFRRERVKATSIEGDAFHRYDRAGMKEELTRREQAGDFTFSHFGPDANLLQTLEETFRSYAERGRGKTRHYVHDENEAARYGSTAGTFTDWEDLDRSADLLFYEGLHGAYVDDAIDIAQHADLKVGVVPVINLEWIQKIERDRSARGYTTEAVTDTILRRMPDYVHHIVPQFTRTDINFQRVPIVDTSNPFAAERIPPLEESIVVIRFSRGWDIDFPYLIAMIAGSQMSRARSLVVPGGKLDLAMQLILTPMIHRLIERKRRQL